MTLSEFSAIRPLHRGRQVEITMCDQCSASHTYVSQQLSIGCMYVQHQQSVGKNGKKFTKKLLAQKSDSMEPLK